MGADTSVTKIRFPDLVDDIYASISLQQEGGGPVVPHSGRDVQRGLACPVHQVRVRPTVQQLLKGRAVHTSNDLHMGVMMVEGGRI